MTVMRPIAANLLSAILFLVPLAAHAADSLGDNVPQISSLTGSWSTQFDGKAAELALWPEPGKPYQMHGYLYMAEHDCLMAAHVFAFDDELAFGFTAKGMRNRFGNCDKNLMVAVPLFEGDGTIPPRSETQQFTARMSELIIGTPLTQPGSEDAAEAIFRRARPSPDFLTILSTYKHRFRPAPDKDFIAQIRDTRPASPDEFAVTASGLKYKIVSQGNGPRPTLTDTVTVHYRGTLLDGREFDSSYSRGEPASFPLNSVIEGWTEGLQLIAPGGKIKLIIPPELAYGAQGYGPVGPNATLIFDIELLAVR